MRTQSIDCIDSQHHRLSVSHSYDTSQSVDGATETAGSRGRAPGQRVWGGEAPQKLKKQRLYFTWGWFLGGFFWVGPPKKTSGLSWVCTRVPKVWTVDYNAKISSANFTFCTSVCAVWAVIMARKPDKSARSSTIGGPRTWNESGDQLTPWIPWLRGPWTETQELKSRYGQKRSLGGKSGTRMYVFLPITGWTVAQALC